MESIKKGISEGASVQVVASYDSQRLQSDRLFISRKFQSISYNGVREQLLIMHDRLHATCTELFLMTEKEICMAKWGEEQTSVAMGPLHRLKLLSGTGFISGNWHVQPVVMNSFVIGYLQVESEAASPGETGADLIELYASLVAKEMELEFNRSKVEYYSHSLIHEKRESKREIEQNSIVMEMAVHDITSPLSAVRGYLELIENSLKKNQDLETIKKYYQKISIGIQDISTILSNFDDLKEIKSEPGTKNLVLTNLNWLISEIWDLYSAKAERNYLELSYNIPNKPVFVHADVSRIKRSVINLITNAIKYSNKGGYIKMILETDCGKAVIRVKDNGIGIRREKRQAVFEPFFQISGQNKKNPGSIGLGLFIAASFVREMNGHIELESEEGAGSCFSIYIPLAPPEGN